MVFAAPRIINRLEDCYFYHAMEIPGFGKVEGEWDLRSGIDRYLGDASFGGMRVLDVGAASGFLSFHMERKGAQVVSYDLSEEHHWDIVPFGGAADRATDEARCTHLRRLNNGYWLAHRALQSSARAAYGTVYAIPAEIGSVDVAVYGSILLHLRDPFLALENGARLASKAMIVADVAPFGPYGRFLKRPMFFPSHRRPDLWGTWWLLPPRLVCEFLAILGFPNATVTWHRQLFRGQKRWLYTVVGRK